jgi:hypothetical protein
VTFNHVNPDKKHPQYNNLIRRVVSAEVLDEVDNHVLLCCICLGVLHGQRGRGTLRLHSRVSPQAKVRECFTHGLLKGAEPKNGGGKSLLNGYAGSPADFRSVLSLAVFPASSLKR